MLYEVITDLLERNGGEVHPARAPRLVLAEDPVEVPSGVLPDPLPREPDQILPPAETHRLDGTGLRAGRDAALADPLVAEGALLDPGFQGASVIVGRRIEGTGHHAIPAPEADVGIVENRPLGGFRVRNNFV